MAENDKYGKPIVLPDGIKVAFDTSTGEWTRSDKIDPQNILKTNVLDTGYKKDDFKTAAQAQGLYGQDQPAPQQPTQPTTIQTASVNTTPIASVPVTPTPVTPATTVTETIATVAETAGNVVASDLTSTVKEGVAMVNDAQDMANMFIPDNNS